MRTGLRICGARGNKQVKNSVIRFAEWLRKESDFPIRVAVYLLPGKNFITVDGHRVVASFRWLGRRDEPYIRLVTGDYPDLRAEHGRDIALKMILESLARQIIRYQNWVKTKKVTEHGVDRKGRGLVDHYASFSKKI